MGPLFGLPELSVAVAEAPDLSKLAGELRKRVKFDEKAGTLAVIGPLTAAERDELGRCFGGEAGKRAVQKLYAASIGAAEGQVPPMHVPALCVRVDGQLEMFEESHFLDAQWDLHNCDAALAETEFPSEIVDGADGEVDISEAGRVQTRYIGQVRKQLILLRPESGWSMGKLVSEIDRAISHVDIPLAQSVPFITRAIDRLIRQRGVTVDQLAAQRGRLAAAVAGLMDRHRKAMRKAGYQRLLLGPKDKVFAVDPGIYYLIAQDRYAPNWYYEGAYAFQRAALRVGELKAEGEEFECARHIDQLPQVKRWVRNLAGPGREDGSVWLQTSTDKFYPDFVAELLDGRFLVVEYKNAREWSDEDSLEKRTLGEFWAERSGGRIIFVMPQGISDLGAIDRAIAVPSAGGR